VPAGSASAASVSRRRAPERSRFQSMRLLAYTDTTALGGADLALAHVVERLDSGIEVAVAGVSPAIVKRVAAGRPGATLRVLDPPRSGHDVRALTAHLSAVRSFAPNIVHTSLASPWSCQYAIAASGLARTRVVAVYQLPRPAVNRRQRVLRRLTSPAVAQHVGVGERTSREVEQLLGLPVGRVRTIHNGVPDEGLEAPERPFAGPVVGAVGRLEPQKGFDVFLRALRDVPQASAVIVGDGEQHDQLDALADGLGLQDRVHWVGWRDDRRSYLPWFDVFVLPSRFEGFPLALLEALLAEKAVVATDVGSVAEAVLPDQTGLLVPPDDPAALAAAIQKLLSDEALRRRLGAAGRELVLSRFTAAHMAHSFERLYAEILR
jgi:glycosyltransferase involved in cell wall biosynthesis